MSELGIEIPEILLPRGADISRWAVIACDQFTQDRAYWERAREAAGGKPSALNLILPEAFLADNDHAERISGIHRAMRDYMTGGVFAAPRRGLVYLERDTPFNRGRRGLVAAVDLEQYDWSPQARPLIRSTEDTVPDRLPPRMEIRRGAPLETPHILLLIDDDEDFLLRGLGERAKKNAPAYQGSLMLNSGSISGWFLDAPDNWAFFTDGLEKLLQRSLTRYGGGGQPFLFAVGDGNHSLASARGIWEEYKAKNAAAPAKVAAGALPVHPCRYALVEIENIYDPAIQFEPIHRVVFGLDFDGALRLLSALPDFTSRIIASREELVRLTAESAKGNRFGIISGGRYALVTTSAGGIATVSLQPLLDQAVANGVTGGNVKALSIDCMRRTEGSETNTLPKQQPALQGVVVDYIHGEDELFRLASGSGNAAGGPVTGILLPPVQKDGFFETVARCGPLPRKSFSMGEAEEKRFYIECRKLFG